jgi:hypothetical protein
VVVVPDFSNWPADERQPRFLEAYRVAQPGARIVLLAAQKRGVLWSAPAKDAPARDQILHLYTRAGAVAARELANADGVAYYEGRNPREA